MYSAGGSASAAQLSTTALVPRIVDTATGGGSVRLLPGPVVGLEVIDGGPISV